ncbi:MAG: hypothetical protein KGI58_01015 [Patescibacteria group bacterium]|nr:hypothetical protein [Patescibacteria group bacterium]
MSWASHRQTQYLSGLLIFIGLVVFIIAWPSISRKPTCSDGKQNGTETGIDCGGSCQRICNADASEPIVLWQRAFPVTGSDYNLVALVENRNKQAAVAQASYEFRIYNSSNILIGRRLGTTFIPPDQQFAIFEPRFDSGASDIKSVTFDFTSPFIWLKKNPTFQTLPVTIDNVLMGSDKSNPSITARINNNSIYDLPAFNVVTILYDADHNAINASETHKDGLASNASSSLIFTWPQPFSDNPVTKDMIIMLNPFTTSF